MAVTKEKKVEVLNDLVAKFKVAKSIWFATTKTITVKEFAELRKSLREVDANYTLAKKTLIVKAIKQALDIDIEISTLEWQIWVVCSNTDAVSGMWKVNDYLKIVNKKAKAEKIVWSGSIFEWVVKTAAETNIIASMPSRETLLSRLVGSMKSPISGLARFFDAAAKELETQWKAKVNELKVAKVEAPVEVKAEEATAE